MSEPTYTIDDLQLACEDTVPVETFDAIKARLTRPKHSFSNGQILIQTDKIHEFIYYFDHLSTKDLRPLTLTEHGDGVKALRDWVASGNYTNNVDGISARSALEAFDASLSPENSDE